MEHLISLPLVFKNNIIILYVVLFYIYYIYIILCAYIVYRYAKNAKIASNRFKDRPMTPQQSVVYWTEYVIRHKGAPHLKSHALNLTWYQYLLLDVIAVTLIFVLLVTFVVFKVFKCIKTFTKYKVKTQ